MAEVAGDAALFADPASPPSIAQAFLNWRGIRRTATAGQKNTHRRAKTLSQDRAARETAAVLAAASARV